MKTHGLMRNTREAVVEEALRDLGFIIEPQFLFRKMVKMVENRSFDIEFLQKSNQRPIWSLLLATILKRTSTGCSLICSSTLLNWGHTVKDRSAVMAKNHCFSGRNQLRVEDTKIDVLGNAYEYLIGQFAATAGKKAGEFYTPSGPAELLCRLACLGLTDVKGRSRSHLVALALFSLRLKNYANVRNYYGQGAYFHHLQPCPNEYDPSWHSLLQFQYLQR